MQRTARIGRPKTARQLVTGYDKDAPTPAKLIITSYEIGKVYQCHRAVLANRKGLKVEVGPPKRAKVALDGKEPPLWGCEGKDLKRVIVSLEGTVSDMVKMTMIKTISGVYMQLMLQDIRIKQRA